MGVVEVILISRVYNWHACPAGSVSHRPPTQKERIRFRFPSKMVELANLFFILFSTVSPKPLFHNNNNSSMDMEANPNISPVVLFKSNTLPTETISFSTKPNPLPIKSRLPIFIEPLPVFAGVGPAVNLVDMEVNPTLVIILVTVFLLLLLLLLLIRYVLPKDLSGCVNDCGLPIQCKANFSKRAAYEQI